MTGKQRSDVHQYLEHLYRLLVLLTEKTASLQTLQKLYSEADVACERETARGKRLLLQAQMLETQIRADMEAFVHVYRDIQGRVSGVEDNTERLVLQYRYLDCLTPEQIAEKMACSVKRVNRLLQRALARIHLPFETPCEKM